MSSTLFTSGSHRARAVALGAVITLALAWLVAIPTAAEAAGLAKVTVSLDSDSAAVDSVRLEPGTASGKATTIQDGATRTTKRVKGTGQWARVAFAIKGEATCEWEADVTWTYTGGSTRTLSKSGTGVAMKALLGADVSAVEIDLTVTDCRGTAALSVAYDSSTDEAPSAHTPSGLTVASGSTATGEAITGSWKSTGVFFTTKGTRKCSYSASITFTYTGGNTRTVTREGFGTGVRMKLSTKVASVDVDLAVESCTAYDRVRIKWDDNGTDTKAWATGNNGWWRATGSSLYTNLRPIDENKRVGFTVWTSKACTITLVDTNTGKTYTEDEPSTKHKYYVPRFRDFEATVVSCDS